MPYILGALVLIGAVWMPLNFFFERKKNKPAALVFKALGTATAVALAIYGCVFQPQQGNYAALVLTGLCVCVWADVMLDVRFKVGGTLFFIGHVLYVAAFFTYDSLTLWSLLVFVVALLLLNWVLDRFKDGIPEYLYSSLVLYSVALSALLAISLPLPWLAFSKRTVLGATGSLMFVISDLLLCRNKVEGRGPKARIWSLGAYYLAQVLLAASTFSTL